MGCKELIESLRASGDEKIAALRAEAGQEAAKVRADAGRAIEALRAGYERRKAGLADEIAAERASQAQESIRRVMLAAEKKLCDRLSALARSSLRKLRNEGYGETFRSFVSELPRFAWKTVRVNPGVAELARTFFP
jgi:vacuolar-type H+-ATPase subunit E/Vma4